MREMMKRLVLGVAFGAMLAGTTVACVPESSVQELDGSGIEEDSGVETSEEIVDAEVDGRPESVNVGGSMGGANVAIDNDADTEGPPGDVAVEGGTGVIEGGTPVTDANGDITGVELGDDGVLEVTEGRVDEGNGNRTGLTPTSGFGTFTGGTVTFTSGDVTQDDPAGTDADGNPTPGGPIRFGGADFTQTGATSGSVIGGIPIGALAGAVEVDDAGDDEDSSLSYID